MRSGSVDLPPDAEVGLLKEVQENGAHLAGYGQGDTLISTIAERMNNSG